MALIDIVRDAAVEVGLSPPSSVASSTALSDQQWLRLANKAGREIAAWHDWSALSTPGTITGDGATTVWAMPTDFDRFAAGQKVIIDGAVGTIFAGPLSPQEITLYRARNPITVSHIFYRRGQTLVTGPALGDGRVAVLEYQSKIWASDSAGVPKARFTADTDLARFPDEELVTLALVWMWRAQKRFDYAQEYETWRQRCQLVAGRDRTLTPVASGTAMIDLPEPITPDTIIATG